MNPDGKNRLLLFQKLYLDLSGRIADGEFPLDSRLPTESALMEHYAVSITTVRKAVQMLADRGIVAKRQGAGTFVTSIPAEQTARPSSGSPLKIGVFLPDTATLSAEGDRRHWALNLRRLNGIYTKASGCGASVFVHAFCEYTEKQKLDGAICMPAYACDLGTTDALRRKLVRRLEEKRIPFVTISEFDPRFASRHWVTELIEQEFFKATSFLITRGQRKIALLGPALSWPNPRYSGYRKALERAGITPDEQLIQENTPSDSESAYSAAKELLNRAGGRKGCATNLNAILCTTDLQAYGVLNFLREKKIAVPEEISVMGIDNLPESETPEISLTSLEFSGASVGAKALDLLLDVIAGRYPDGVTMSFPGRIFERGTTAPRRKGLKHERTNFPL